jgi:hypothetical protein
MTSPRANYQSWLWGPRNLLTNAGRRLSRALSTEWVRFRRSSWPTAEQAVLGLLRNSAAFLTAPLHPNYRPSFPAGSSPTNGCARMNDVHNSVKRASDGRSLEQKSLPAPELAPSARSSHLVSGPRPVLVANVREFALERAAKQRSATVPTLDPQAERDKTVPDAPFMDAGSEMDTRRSFQAALASAIETAIQAESQQASDQKLDAQLCDLLDRRRKEFCSHIEGRLNFFYDQTAMRLDALSDQIVKKFCESLSQQAAATLNAVVVASAQQSKSALSAESEHALDGFGRQISELSEAHLEAHRKEVQVLSSNLQLRLRRVAYTLEDVGAAEMPGS